MICYIIWTCWWLLPICLRYWLEISYWPYRIVTYAFQHKYISNISYRGFKNLLDKASSSGTRVIRFYSRSRFSRSLFLSNTLQQPLAPPSKVGCQPGGHAGALSKIEYRIDVTKENSISSACPGLTIMHRWAADNL